MTDVQVIFATGLVVLLAFTTGHMAEGWWTERNAMLLEAGE